MPWCLDPSLYPLTPLLGFLSHPSFLALSPCHAAPYAWKCPLSAQTALIPLLHYISGLSSNPFCLRKAFSNLQNRLSTTWHAPATCSLLYHSFCLLHPSDCKFMSVWTSVTVGTVSPGPGTEQTLKKCTENELTERMNVSFAYLMLTLNVFISMHIICHF